MCFEILGKWGHVEADGTWSGLVRHAKDEVVDFVICDVFLTYSRSQVTSDELYLKVVISHLPIGLAVNFQDSHKDTNLCTSAFY